MIWNQGFYISNSRLWQSDFKVDDHYSFSENWRCYIYFCWSCQ